MRWYLWWPVIGVIVAWSFFVWIGYTLIETVFGAIAGLFGAVLGSWASWLINGAGDIGQLFIVIVWLIVSWKLTAPLRRPGRW